ncbi:hypothetical protein B0T21DRAFT_348101 [Apiosordaria backusii]|uniref:Uncharacterized protein n=1 Tax=Apiosordaria backusii TaxID=314023 RepID=A0AA40BKL8_9PEZI|nr:hypothetical protein B0T21DRAFT_348101 [Apiosordaria backusii]
MNAILQGAAGDKGKETINEFLNKALDQLEVVENASKGSLFWTNWVWNELDFLITIISSLNAALENVIARPTGDANHTTTATLLEISLPGPQMPPLQHDNAIETGEHLSQPSCSNTNTNTSSKMSICQVIKHLHNSAQNGLRIIVNSTLGGCLRHLLLRLQRWGEILDGPLALDSLFSKFDNNGERLMYKSLREIVITILVDIVLLEERSSPAALTAFIDIDASLAAQDARDIATVRPMASHVSDYAGMEELFGAAEKELEDAVNGLFQILPTVRMIRRGVMLDWEADNTSDLGARVNQATIKVGLL